MLRAGGAIGPGVVVAGATVVAGAVVGATGGGATIVVDVESRATVVVVVVEVVVVAVAMVVVVVVVVVALDGSVVVVVVVEVSAGGWARATNGTVIARDATRPPTSAIPIARCEGRRCRARTRGWRAAGGGMIDHWCIGTDASRVEHESAESPGGVHMMTPPVLAASLGCAYRHDYRRRG